MDKKMFYFGEMFYLAKVDDNECIRSIYKILGKY